MQGNLAEKNRKTLIFFEVIGTMFMTILYRIFLEFLTLTVLGPAEIVTNARIPFFFAFFLIIRFFTYLYIESSRHFYIFSNLNLFFIRKNKDIYKCFVKIGRNLSASTENQAIRPI